ncbi:MAG: VWA domain-containing protein [Bacteroidota bacterium]
METGLISRKTDLPAQLVQFCRYLRGQGFFSGPQEETDALQAFVQHVPANPEEFGQLLAAVLVKSKDQYFRFPELFKQYWSQLERAENSKVTEQEEEQGRRKPAQRAPSIQELKNWLYNGRQSTEEEEIAAFSAAEVFTQKDFSAFSATEVEEIIRIIRQLAHWLAHEQRRRWVTARKARQIDLARSMRKNSSRGGELDYFMWRRRKPQRQKVTLFCDVSKSMDLYARFLIQFMYGFHRVSTRLETFVFSTGLTRISPALHQREFNESLEHLSELVPNWSGGTNIGQSFLHFRRDYGRRYLDRQTTVMILSDGWDQGEAAQLDEQLHFLKKHSRRIIWINPLAGRPGYEPQTVGMQTALPFVDYFTSAHNLETLVEMIRWMR